MLYLSLAIGGILALIVFAIKETIESHRLKKKREKDMKKMKLEIDEIIKRMEKNFSYHDFRSRDDRRKDKILAVLKC